MYDYTPIDLHNKTRNFFWKSYVRYLFLNENRALKFNFSKTKFQKQLNFYDQE